LGDSELVLVSDVNGVFLIDPAAGFTGSNWGLYNTTLSPGAEKAVTLAISTDKGLARAFDREDVVNGDVNSRSNLKVLDMATGNDFLLPVRWPLPQ